MRGYAQSSRLTRLRTKVPYLLYGMKLSPIASLIELVETFAFLLLKIDFTKRACGKMLRAWHVDC